MWGRAFCCTWLVAARIPATVEVCRQVGFGLTVVVEAPGTVAVLEPGAGADRAHLGELIARVMPVGRNGGEEQIVEHALAANPTRQQQVAQRASSRLPVRIGMAMKVAEALQGLAQVQGCVFEVFVEELTHGSAKG